MIYSDKMKEILFCIPKEAELLFRHYLDHYFENYEEPVFNSYELKKIWYVLLYEGLLAEIANETKNYMRALKRFTLLVDHNSASYNKEKSENTYYMYKTIKEAEKIKERNRKYQNKHSEEKKSESI